jgi:hypothetical protein
MVLQWIDRFAGLAYVCVRGPLSAFEELLKGIDRLIADPNWHAGMAILEDLRDYEGDPQPDSLERWRAYVAERGPRLQGCRWAVVRRADNPALTSVLDTAAQHATKAGVTLRQFTSTVDAHAWLSQASGVAVVLLACG